MRYAQIVMGPAGSGKSTYCSTLAAHGQVGMCIKFIHFLSSEKNLAQCWKNKCFQNDLILIFAEKN